MNLQAIIQSIDAEIGRLQQARAILGGAGLTAIRRRQRHMSAAVKARIAASQRARWAKVKSAQKKKK